MNKNNELLPHEEKLIQEMAQMIAEINLQDSNLRESVFRGLASYVEGINVGLDFRKNSIPTKLR